MSAIGTRDQEKAYTLSTGSWSDTEFSVSSFGSRQNSGQNRSDLPNRPRYTATPEIEEVSSTSTPSSGTTAVETRPPLPKAVPPGPAFPPARRSTRQYLALARPLLVKQLLTQLDGIAAHAQTPSAGVYVYQIDRLAIDALERFFDDGFLDLVLAVRNALVINNAWMHYTAEQIRTTQDLIRKYSRMPSDNGRIFRDAVLELNQLGINTTPFNLPTDLLFDEEE
jgi:hypothetical protein